MADDERKPTDANAWAAAGGTFDAKAAEVVAAMPPDPLGEVWRTVGEWDWLTSDPPARRYLLTDTSGSGVLPLGRVGMLASAGGQGKSWALTLLALCVAAGVDWLGTFKVSEGGFVLLALAEEEAEEMRRRLFYGAKALGLNAAERALVAKRIVALPLCGRSVALTYSPEETRALGLDALPGTILETDFARDLRAKLQADDHEWRLIVLDPISRFAGPDVEVDNAAATRFVQTLETFTHVRGNPTLLVAHHTSKSARKEGGADASAARGASGLTDAVRWQANLVPVEDAPDFVRFEVTKSNYAKFPRPVWLHRDAHGELHRATKEEAERQVAETKAKREQKSDAAPKQAAPEKRGKRVSAVDLLTKP